MRAIWFLMAAASAMEREGAPCVPVRTPLTARPPASIHTKLSPRLFICCSTRDWPALPMATTQITAAMPAVIHDGQHTAHFISEQRHERGAKKCGIVQGGSYSWLAERRLGLSRITRCGAEIGFI